jgi:FixJ family two-component response regulator
MITVYLKSAKDGLEIIIEDNGCGIPPDLLSRIFEQGFSFNKKNGAGFGLSYSKQCIEQLGGRLVVQSELNIGTKITITLNRSVTPDWFCDAIFINDRTQTVILDDDPSIHHAWIERFSKVTDNKLIHFYKASDFIEKYHDIKYKTGLYLIDYELLNDNMNGLDVIQKLSISDKSFLVTSCFEDKDIRERSIQHGNKIIPKSYVPYIPIQYAPIQSQNFINKNQIIFIDNDELMRATWIFAAKAAGISISTYTSFNEFKKVSNQYEKNILIYIDSDLGDEAKGEVYAKQLFEQGFTEIHLCTGHHPQQFSNMPWIKSITGKEFPFIHHKELL